MSGVLRVSDYLIITMWAIAFIYFGVMVLLV